MQYILVTYTCKPGQRQAFLDALNGEGLAAKCRAEDGNIKYDYYFPENGNENELFLREIWQSAEALKAQHGSEVDKKKIDLPSPIKQTGVQKVNIKLFEGVSAKVKVKVTVE